MKHAGHTSFNAEDRLAVANLVNSYGYYYDQFLLDKLHALFVEEPQLEFWIAGEMVVDSFPAFMAILRRRSAVYKSEGIQRRHLLTSLRFNGQSGGECTGQASVVLYSSDGAGTSLVTTGLYEFTSTKVDDEWRLSEWIARVDSPMD